MPDAPGPSPHFLNRENDGSARVRMRFTAEEAADYEEAAGTMPVLDWMHRALQRAARDEIAHRRRSRPKLQPRS